MRRANQSRLCQTMIFRLQRCLHRLSLLCSRHPGEYSLLKAISHQHETKCRFPEKNNNAVVNFGKFYVYSTFRGSWEDWTTPPLYLCARYLEQYPSLTMPLIRIQLHQGTQIFLHSLPWRQKEFRNLPRWEALEFESFNKWDWNWRFKQLY